MKIAFDLRRIKNPGIGRYMKCLVEAVMARSTEHEYLLILPPDACGTIQIRCGRAEAVVTPVKCYSIREQFELPRILQRHRVDLLHSPHFNLPLISPCPVVVTLHDVIYLACRKDLPSRLGRMYYRAMMEAAVRRAQTIVTVSEFSRSEIVRFLPAGRAKIKVIHSGIDPGFTREKDVKQVQRALKHHGVTEDYVLYGGIYKPRKNHAGLLHAFKYFLNKNAQTQLVIAGPVEEGEHKLRALAGELEIANRVIFTGFVDDATLRALYSAARVYACPSLYEGFGFTVLEAMACGAPVVSSQASSLPEVAGDAAIYADARDPEQFAAAMCRVFSDAAVREKLMDAGRKNLERFRWNDVADRMVRVYEETAGAPARKVAYA